MYTTKGTLRVVALTLLISQSDVSASQYLQGLKTKFQQFQQTEFAKSYVNPALQYFNGISTTKKIAGFTLGAGLITVYRKRNTIANAPVWEDIKKTHLVRWLVACKGLWSTLDAKPKENNENQDKQAAEQQELDQLRTALEAMTSRATGAEAELARRRAKQSTSPQPAPKGVPVVVKRAGQLPPAINLGGTQDKEAEHNSDEDEGHELFG